MRRRIGLLTSIVSLCAMVRIVPAADLTVGGNANIFGAGHSVAPAPGGGGAGVLPPSIQIDGASIIRFPSVTGLVNEGSGPAYEGSWNGPDGTPWASNYDSVGGIAGLLMPNRMPLVGVFLSDSEPADPAPARLDFNLIGFDFASLSPQPGQVFFIGDGRTSGGTLQNFIVPAGATRLFLGIADADSHQGPPGLYGDNQGAFTVSGVPEPSALLVIVAAATITMGGRRPRCRPLSEHQRNFSFPS